MLARFQAFIERHALWVVVAWVAAGAVLFVGAPSLQKVGVQDQASFVPPSAPSQQADRVVHRLFPNDPTLDASVLVYSRSTPLTAADHRFIAGVAAGLPHRVPNVRSVESAESDPRLQPQLVSQDGKAEMVVVGLKTAPSTPSTNAAVTQMRRLAGAGAPAGLSHDATGVAPFSADQMAGIMQSFNRTAVISAALVILALLLVYRSIAAALVPMVTIGVAYAVAAGAVGLLAAHGFKVATMAGTFMVVMVFGAGTDYCLFIVSRFRSELRGGDQGRALSRTMVAMAAVIVASAITVSIGFLSLLTAQFGAYRTMGPAIAVGIVVTLVAALTLTPALLHLLGRRAFWPASLEHIRRTGDKPSRLWTRIGAHVAAHPRRVAAGVTLGLGVCAIGLVTFHESFDVTTQQSASADSTVGFNVIARHFPGGASAPAYVVIDGPGPMLTDARLAAVDRLTEQMRSIPGVAQVRSVTQPLGAPLTAATLPQLTGGSASPSSPGLPPAAEQSLAAQAAQPGGLRFTGPVLNAYPSLTHQLSGFLGADGSSTRLIVAVRGDPYSPASLTTVRNLNTFVEKHLAGSALSGDHVYVAGPSTFFGDIQVLGNHDFLVMVAALIVAVFAILAVLLRSLVAPFYLLATVGLSYAATMGLLSSVFDRLIGQSSVTFFVPVFLFVILVALGADYNIFIMSRIAEERVRGANAREASVRGLVLTGKPISSAGLILAGTFAALLAAPIPPFRQIGFAVTAGVLIDTFVVRSLLVPAITFTLGRWAFWPSGFAPRGVARVRQFGTAGAALAALGGVVATLLVVDRVPSPPMVIPAAAAPTAAPTEARSSGPVSVAHIEGPVGQRRDQRDGLPRAAACSSRAPTSFQPRSARRTFTTRASGSTRAGRRPSSAVGVVGGSTSSTSRIS